MTTAITPYKQLKSMASSDAVRKRFADILGDNRAPAFLATVLNTVYQNKALQSCDPTTVLAAGAIAAALGLPVDPNIGYAWIVPYGGKAQFQLGYKGYIQLALRTGLYELLNATEVYQGEHITEDRLTGQISMEGARNGDEVTGFVAYFKLKTGFEKFVYMPIADVHAHAKEYSKSYGKPNSAWTTAFNEMGKKTVIRRLLSKYGVLTADMTMAFDSDLNGSEPKPPPIDFPQFDDLDTIDAEAEDVTDFDAAGFLARANLSQNDHAARGLLAYFPDDRDLNQENLEPWAKLYRAWRDAGTDPAASAQNATAGALI